MTTIGAAATAGLFDDAGSAATTVIVVLFSTVVAAIPLYLTIRIAVTAGMREHQRWLDGRQRPATRRPLAAESQRGGFPVSVTPSASPTPVAAPRPAKRFRVTGIDRASKMQAVEHVEAPTPTEAREAAERAGMVVESVEAA